MKPYNHARNSVKHFGGRVEDYLEIHEFIDSSKSSHADMRHRAVLHSAFGIYIVEKVFTNYTRRITAWGGWEVPNGYFKNSDNVNVSIRDVAERHVLEDLDKIPSLSDYLNCMELEQWMGGPVRKSSRFVVMDPNAHD